MSAEGTSASRNDEAPQTLDPLDLALRGQGSSAADQAASRELICDQARLVRSQIMSERAGFALKLLTGAVGVVAAVVLGLFVVDAARSERLILEAFSVPPAFEERGLTGEVVATRIGDALTAMQFDTLASRAPSSYSRASDLDLAVEIPRTGISIGELRAFLRSWLGRERRVSGEVVRVADGYAITARASGSAGKSFTRAEAEFDEAIRLAAEAVFEMTSPDRYASYLVRTGRVDEARALYQKLSIQGSRKARAWALAEWTGLDATSEEKLDRARRARALDERQPLAAVAISDSLKDLGRLEEARAEYARSGELLRGRSAADLAPWWAALHSLQHRAEVRRLAGDYVGAAELNEAAGEPLPDQPPLACSNCSSYAFAMAGRDLALAHDAAGARAMARRSGQILPEYADEISAYVEFLVAWGDRDWARVLELWQASESAVLVRPILLQSLGRAELTAIMAESLARQGRLEDASAAMTGTKGDCYPCLRARAVMAALQGRVQESDRLFGLATEAAPSLPHAWFAWGEAKAARGDASGAIAAFARASLISPRWADPLKSWGDVLARQGEHRAAERKYAEAAERAPNWTAPRQALATARERIRAASRR
jgi:tetratricopeptide (TPR) repeat protein